MTKSMRLRTRESRTMVCDHSRNHHAEIFKAYHNAMNEADTIFSPKENCICFLLYSRTYQRQQVAVKMLKLLNVPADIYDFVAPK